MGVSGKKKDPKYKNPGHGSRREWLVNLRAWESFLQLRSLRSSGGRLLLGRKPTGTGTLGARYRHIANSLASEWKDGSAGQDANPEGSMTEVGRLFLDMVEVRDSDHSGTCAELGGSTLYA